VAIGETGGERPSRPTQIAVRSTEAPRSWEKTEVLTTHGKRAGEAGEVSQPVVDSPGVGRQWSDWLFLSGP